MKTLHNFEIIKETEKAALIGAMVEELNAEKEFWLPKSKFEQKGDVLEIEDEIWNDKLDELKNPPEQDSIILYVEKLEEQEKSFKLILKAKLKSLNLHPWMFIPKSLVLEHDELDTEENEKFYFKIPVWFWEKTLSEIIENQLEFFNKDKDEENEELLKKKDFKLLNKIEE